MALVWCERQDSEQPGGAGCSARGGKATGTWLLDTVSGKSDLQAAITQIVGSVKYSYPGDNYHGIMNRTLPAAHPTYQYWYADNITSIRGAGPCLQQAPSQPLECPPLAEWLLYEKYLYTVDFTPRPYPVLSDANVPWWNNATWINDNQVTKTFNVAGEWVRFVHYEMKPSFDWLTVQKGYEVFKSNLAPLNAGKTTFPAILKMLMPNYMVRFIWEQVPLRYLISPNTLLLKPKFLGRINQNTLYLGPLGTYVAGSLLWMGPEILRIYTPPVQELIQFPLANGAVTFSTDKICDIALNFLFTGRYLQAGDNPVPTQTSFTTAGWNLLPWFQTRGFYYAETLPDAGLGVPATPSFLGFPAEVIWTDPDLGQPGDPFA